MASQASTRLGFSLAVDGFGDVFAGSLPRVPTRRELRSAFRFCVGTSCLRVSVLRIDSSSYTDIRAPPASVLLMLLRSLYLAFQSLACESAGSLVAFCGSLPLASSKFHME